MPEIYVASLSDYNSGDLHGEWFDLDNYADTEELVDAITAMVQAGPAAMRGDEPEEWAIHDSAGFYDIRIGEYENLGDVFALNELFSRLDKSGKSEAFAVWFDSVSDYDDFSNLKQAEEEFDEAYLGDDTPEEYAREYVEETNEIPPILLGNIDWDGVADDLGVFEEQGFLFRS
jgi:antirestriction protein